MKTHIKLIVYILILSIFNIRGLSAQDISTTFIDINAASNDYKPKDQPTMDGIETAFGLDQQDPKQILERLSNYVAPILENQETSEALRQIAETFSYKYEDIFKNPNTDRVDFLALSPLLDAIERTEDSNLYEELRGTWTDNLRGFALSSLISALRFGACVELGMKLINEEIAESDILCERPDYGKINDWHYYEKDGSGSFHLDDMKVDLYELSLNSDNKIEYKLVKQWSYNWQISIESSGYFQAKRMDLADYELAKDSDPDVDPFEWISSAPISSVNLPSLPASAKNVPDGAIWPGPLPDFRDLNHRLFANGLSIKVDKVEGTLYKMRPAVADEVNRHEDPISKKDFVRDGIEKELMTLAPEHPYLQPSTDSCIDIMLNLKGSFPVTINDHPFNTDQKGWCLGRCTKPVIQNSR